MVGAAARLFPVPHQVPSAWKSKDNGTYRQATCARGGWRGASRSVWAPVLGEPLPELRGRRPAHSRTSPRAPSHVWSEREPEPQAVLCPCRMGSDTARPATRTLLEQGTFIVPAGPFLLPTWFSLAAAMRGSLGKRGMGRSR